mgnify:CR=1 FL=1
MRYETFIRKCDELKDPAITVRAHKTLTSELNRTVKQSAKCWLETHNALGAADTFQEWEGHWHYAKFNFKLRRQGSVEVELYAADFSFSAGNTATLMKKVHIPKKELFS